MTVPVAPTVSTIYDEVRAFILGLITCEVVQGRDNLVAPIQTGIVITPLFETRLSTNTHEYFDTQGVNHIDNGTTQTTQSLILALQIDCYGPLASGWANIISTMWRDEYACEAMAPNCQPIDADDPRSLEFGDAGEQKYIERWMLTATLQYNPVVTTSMQFFDAATDPVLTATETLI